VATTVNNTAASLNGKTLVKLEDNQTVVGLKTFDRGTSAPFGVVPGAAVVANLDADFLDGEDGADFHDASLLTGILAALSGVNLTNLNASNLASGSVPLARLGLLAPMICGGRLTLTTAQPVTVADVTAATTIYYTPYKHNRIGLYTAAAWAVSTFAEVSIAVPAAANQMYDVFLYDNAGVLTLELVAWTNDTTRATAIVRQDGVWCKTGALDRRYLGSFRTTAVAGQTEDSFAKRLVWNNDNRLDRGMRVLDTTNSWAYSTATYRQANAAAANQLAMVVGVAEVFAQLEVASIVANTTAGSGPVIGIGYDSTTAPTAGNSLGRIQIPINNYQVYLLATLEHAPAVGFHFYAWIERGSGSGADTWYGDNGDPSLVQSGLRGSIEG
jgi:hypothetical protein